MRDSHDTLHVSFPGKRVAFYAFPFLLFITLLIYFPPYSWAWVGDDYVQLDYIKDFVANPHYFYRFFNPYFIGWYYRPFQNIWLMANRILFGLNPFGYYWLQLCIHLLAVSLVYRVGRQLGLRPFPALCTSTLFAIHGHHVDVVGWISSIAIVTMAVWNLLGLWAFLRYLKRPSLRLLMLTLLFCLLGMVTHEEWVLLPPALGLLVIGEWLLKERGPEVSKRAKRDKPSHLRFTIYDLRLTRLMAQPSLLLAFLILFILSALYIYFQFTRTNLTIDLAATPATHWTEYLAPLPVSQFFVDTFSRFFLLVEYQPQLRAYSFLVTYLMLLGLGLWFWKAGKIGRFGLLWAVIHLAFIYLALWSQKPHLYAGRHIYNAGLGVVLAIGEVIGRLEIRNWRLRRVSLQSPIPNILVFAVLTAVLITHVFITRQTQADWLAKAEEDKGAALQMKGLMPTVTADTHVFANRFPITPNFLRSFTEVWYNQFLTPPSGGIAALREHGLANPNFYVFDYDNDNTLYNLMPELQQHDRTIFIWNHSPRVKIILPTGESTTADPETYDEYIVAGPPGERRLAVRVQPPNEEWFSLAYAVTVPEDSVLRFGIRQEVEETAESASLTFRVRITPVNGETSTLWETTLQPTGQWQDAEIPMGVFREQAVLLHLEIAGGNGQMRGYWSNPRFTIR